MVRGLFTWEGVDRRRVMRRDGGNKEMHRSIETRGRVGLAALMRAAACRQ